MEAFMEHLSKELSMECLLSLIEFLQFREKAQDPQYHNTLKKSKLRTSIDQEFGDWKMAEHVPKSTIVHTQKCDKSMALKLFEKYIVEGADHEINISHRLRISLNHIFQADTGFLRTITSIGRKFDENQSSKDEQGPLGRKGLPFVFDACISEMLLLLNYSFVRWKTRGSSDINFARLMKAECGGNYSPQSNSHGMHFP